MSAIMPMRPASSPQDLSTVSVREFFGAIVWTGEPKPTNIGADLATEKLSFAGGSMALLTVQAFFQQLPWEGEPDIAAPLSTLKVQSEPSSAADELTLDDFAKLF